MTEESLFLIVLAVVLVVLLARTLAGRLGVPEAILMVVLGVAAGFVPGMPDVRIPPEVVLTGFLPPLIYHAAFFTAPREAREDAAPIITLAFGLTLVVTFAIAAVGRWVLPIPGWPAAIAFAAAIAPTDPVSATSVLQRLGAPPRIVTIVEGESLINDGMALTLFGLAVEAMGTDFTMAHGVARIAEVIAGSVAFGLVVGFLVGRLRRRIRDPGSQVLMSLLTPFIAYVPAEHLHLSGVLATAVAGFYLGTRGEGVLQPASRIPGRVFWTVLAFMLESGLFVLLGLELPTIVEDLPSHPWARLGTTAVAVVATAVVVRLAWTLLVFPLARYLPGRHLDFDSMPWRQRVVVGWSGMRGAISLAIALSLPTAVGGRPLRGRAELVFLAAVVVFITLVGHTATLPRLLRFFGLVETDRRTSEVVRARRGATEAALTRLDELVEGGQVTEYAAAGHRRFLEHRLERIRAEPGDEESSGDLAGAAEIHTELVRAQRTELRRLYRQGRIGAETMREVGRRLDLEDPRTRPGPD